MHFHAKCKVLMRELCNSKDYYLVAQGYKKVSSCKSDKYKNEMIGETQPELELLEVVTFIYPFSLNAGTLSHLQMERNSSTQHRWILTAVLKFSLNMPWYFVVYLI